MLSDSLFEIHDQLKKDLEHYTTGTFHDYYSKSFQNEVKILINRIDELRSYLDGSSSKGGEFNYFLILDSNAIKNKTVERDNFIMINTNASRFTVEASINSLINKEDFDYMDSLKIYLEEKGYFCQILLFDINNKKNIIDISNLL